MKPSDHLSMYLEACMTTPAGRQAILADTKVRWILGNIPVDGNDLLEAVQLAADKLGPDGGNLVAYLNMNSERINFLQYFNGWVAIEDATKRVMA